MAAIDNAEVSVLIVGAGPVGLTLACELMRRGVSFRLIDKEPVPNDKSRALGIHSRTLEVLESMGLVQTFIDQGNCVYGTNFYHGDKKLVHLSLDEIDGPYPFALMLPQNKTEKILTEHLQKNGIKIERAVELTAFKQDGGSVEATLRHADGSEEVCRIKWIAGTDGAHSTVRHTLGLKFEGEEYPEVFATCEVKVAWDRPQDELDIYVSDDGMLAFFPEGKDIYRIIADEPVAKHKTGDSLSLAEAQAIVDKRGPKGVVLSDPIWMTWFAIHRRSVEEYRVGRAFLLGDAAHIHSPALGQGMNTGMQDAFNLAWKLALVDKELASDKLLESYQSERHPVGAGVLKSTDLVTKVVTIRSPLAANVRNTLMPLLAGQDVVQHRALKNLSMLGVNYRHSPIVGEYKEGVLGGKHTGGALSNLGWWLDFAHGPMPGDRAPDAYIASSADSEAMRLFPVIANGKHNLLLFAGLKSDKSAIDAMNATQSALQSKYGDWLEIFFVAPGEDRPVGLNADTVLLSDVDQTFHHSYGAASQCLYLIRPDGYVGYRSHPIDLAHLITHLQSIFDGKAAIKADAVGDSIKVH